MTCVVDYGEAGAQVFPQVVCSGAECFALFGPDGPLVVVAFGGATSAVWHRLPESFGLLEFLSSAPSADALLEVLRETFESVSGAVALALVGLCEADGAVSH